MKGRRNFIALGLILALFLCAACSPAKKPVSPTPAPTRSPSMQRGTAVAPQPPATTTLPVPGTPATLSDTISREVTRMSGVKSCYTLVVGRTAFIGVSLNNGLSTGKVNTLKKDIAQRAKSFKNISEALVSADPALVKRIRDISEGKSAPGTVKDLYDRLKPQKP